MAALKDVSKVVEELEQRVRRLDEEVARGGADLLQVIGLADEVAEFADSLASTFAKIDEALRTRLEDARAGADGGGKKRQTRRPSAGRRAARPATAEDEPTKSDLLEQAKEAAIPGRSSMTKDELAEAVESHEQLTKDELLERAKAAGITGRSDMSKRQLIEALREEASASREDLVERAKEADIPGRSDMSKDELRQALQST
jgi:hypothetical protein